MYSHNIPTITWIDNSVRIIDQRKLPSRLKFLTCRNLEDLQKAVRTLAVRGAPALGVAAAFGVLLGIKRIRTSNRVVFDQEFKKVCCYIAHARPTAVNTFHALSRMQSLLRKNRQASIPDIKKLLKAEASAIFEEEQRHSYQLGQYGSTLIKKGQRILTICNAGSLATVGYGTALAPMYIAKEEKKKIHVYICETRPLLQGARLSAWELKKAGVDVTLICDHAAAALMHQGKIDMVFVGADRIALNGDTANKIGTYNLAILSHYHRVPFYVVAPFSTFDVKMKSGMQIPIEQRDPREVTFFASQRVAPENICVNNPAFDVTPYSLISAIVTEKGILKPPFKKKILKNYSDEKKSTQ